MPPWSYDVFHSQHGEDRIILAAVTLPTQGVFVDVGAGDAVAFSNTLHFEKNGWTGLCVDADERRIGPLLIGAQRRSSFPNL